jgi:hypothetical protein
VPLLRGIAASAGGLVSSWALAAQDAPPRTSNLRARRKARRERPSRSRDRTRAGIRSRAAKVQTCKSRYAALERGSMPRMPVFVLKGHTDVGSWPVNPTSTEAPRTLRRFDPIDGLTALPGPTAGELRLDGPAESLAELVRRGEASTEPRTYWKARARNATFTACVVRRDPEPGYIFLWKESGINASPEAREREPASESDLEYVRRYAHHRRRLDGGDERLEEVEVVEASLPPGRYHPRIWSGTQSPRVEETPFRDQYIESVRVSRMLSERLRRIFRYVQPERRAHGNVYSHEIRELLVLACIEIESAWKQVLLANGAKHRQWNRTDYVRLVEPMQLEYWNVSLASHGDYGDIRPFGGWNPGPASGGLDWYKAYNDAKHDRENNLSHATLAHAVSAMAALYIMTVAQFGQAHLEHGYFNEDMFICHPPTYPLSRLYVWPGLTASGHCLDAAGWRPVHCSALSVV